MRTSLGILGVVLGILLVVSNGCSELAGGGSSGSSGGSLTKANGGGAGYDHDSEYDRIRNAPDVLGDDGQYHSAFYDAMRRRGRSNGTTTGLRHQGEPAKNLVDSVPGPGGPSVTPSAPSGFPGSSNTYSPDIPVMEKH